MTEFTALLGEEFLKYKPLSQTRAHTPLTHAQHGPCTLNAVGLLSLDVEMRGSPPLAPPHLVCDCGEVHLTLPYLARSAHRTVLQM